MSTYPHVDNVRVTHYRGKPRHRLETTAAPAEWRKTYLRQWRMFRGMTLEQAAEPMGMKYSQLGKIERGRQQYTQKVLESAAELYQCTVTDLLHRSPTEPREAEQILDLLTPEQKVYATSMLRGLLEGGGRKQ